MVKFYRKKPVIIEAMQFTNEDKDRVKNWITCNTSADFQGTEPILNIQTLEGIMIANIGDYIIKGVKGEYYPCKPDIFHLTYEEITDDK